ncbi:5942_t:CDS:2 [Gigaspora rosea]|nr:5942_t:CDS:2 [Gigaspora rosea]
MSQQFIAKNQTQCKSLTNNNFTHKFKNWTIVITKYSAIVE